MSFVISVSEKKKKNVYSFDAFMHSFGLFFINCIYLFSKYAYSEILGKK